VGSSHSKSRVITEAVSRGATAETIASERSEPEDSLVHPVPFDDHLSGSLWRCFGVCTLTEVRVLTPQRCVVVRFPTEVREQTPQRCSGPFVPHRGESFRSLRECVSFQVSTEVEIRNLARVRQFYSPPKWNVEAAAGWASSRSPNIPNIPALRPHRGEAAKRASLSEV